VKHVELRDEWEQFTLKFSVFSPFDEGMFLEGDSGLGLGDLRMQRVPRRDGWLLHKYGTTVTPWECRVKIDNKEGDSCGEWRQDVCGYTKKIQYHFRKLGSGVYNDSAREREPGRILEIENPERYQGELGAAHSEVWLNTDRVFAVNGVIDKCDANFIGDFFFERITTTEF